MCIKVTARQRWDVFWDTVQYYYYYYTLSEKKPDNLIMAITLSIIDRLRTVQEESKMLIFCV